MQPKKPEGFTLIELLVSILPHIEQAALFNAWNQQLVSGGDQTAAGVAAGLSTFATDAGIVMNGYLCPSDPARKTISIIGFNQAVISYAFNAGSYGTQNAAARPPR